MQWFYSKTFNLLAFNLMWFGCVIGRDRLLWLTIPLVFGYAMLLILGGRVPWYKIGLPVLIGIGIDGLLSASGYFSFGSALLLPAWFILLWIAFSTTLSQSLEPLGRNKWLAALLGAIAVPMNYVLGERLGAVEFPYSYWQTVAAISVSWALMLPLFFAICDGSIRSLFTERTGESH